MLMQHYTKATVSSSEACGNKPNISARLRLNMPQVDQRGHLSPLWQLFRGELGVKKGHFVKIIMQHIGFARR